MKVHTEQTWAVVTAGGQSQRFNQGQFNQGKTQTERSSLPQNKLLSLLGEHPVLWHSLHAVLSSMHKASRPLAGVVITASPDAIATFQNIVDSLAIDFPQTPLYLIEGGADRRASVQAGLLKINTLSSQDPPHCVIIHDGARPLLPLDFLPLALNRLEESPDLQGVIAGHPLSDTVKRIRPHDERSSKQEAFIQETVSRHDLWAVQTPQLFRWQPLWDAHQQVPMDLSITDDAALLEHFLGETVALALEPCLPSNLKITTPDDLTLARVYLRV